MDSFIRRHQALSLCFWIMLLFAILFAMASMDATGQCYCDPCSSNSPAVTSGLSMVTAVTAFLFIAEVSSRSDARRFDQSTEIRPLDDAKLVDALSSYCTLLFRPIGCHGQAIREILCFLCVTRFPLAPFPRSPIAWELIYAIRSFVSKGVAEMLLDARSLPVGEGGLGLLLLSIHL